MNTVRIGILRTALVSAIFATLQPFSWASEGDTVDAAVKPVALAGLQFVPLAPCRLLDTRMMPAKTENEKAERTIDLDVERCGRLVPPFAHSYSLEITTMDVAAPETLPVGTGRTKRSSVVPAPALRRLHFPVSDGSHVAVDVVGYYVPPGTPVSPDAAAAAAPAVEPASVSAQSSVLRVGAPRPAELGADGDVLLQHDTPAGYLPGAGVRILPKPAYPWTVARAPTNDLASGFAIYGNPPSGAPTEVASFFSNGYVRFAANAALSARSDYQPGYLVAAGSTLPVLQNVVHNVGTVRPRDRLNGGNERVTFFNAQVWDESGSPGLTMFHAEVEGLAGHTNYNFDSAVYYHNPGQYHFRAYSPAESKETFWVKAATSGSSTTGTRADMYVSGKLGIGVTNPYAALEVKGSSSIALDTEYNRLWIGNPTAPNSYHGAAFDRLGLGFTDNVARLSTDSTTTARPIWIVPQGSDGIFLSTTGKVGIGTGNVANNPAALLATLHVNGGIWATGSIQGATVIGAVYQDLAEWVPASTDMEAGTVVVLNPNKSNEVMPSAEAYDTSVAGVVSAQPGLLLGVASSSKEMIATTGRVKVRVSTVNGAIAIGDLLVTSEISGSAMRSKPIDVGGLKIHRPGTIIGKALEPLAGGEGEILVLLSLQ